MAITLQDQNLVWQKVNKALSGGGPTISGVSKGTDPSIVDQFRGLKLYLATQGGNPQLTFLPFTAEQCNTNHGVDLAGQAVTVYGMYARGRRITGTTSAFVAVHAAATNDATTTTLITARLKAINQEFGFVTGKGLACETGCTIASATAVGGASESDIGDAADGFLIVGS